jgi:chorismate mutase
MSPELRVAALRGAITVPSDARDDIVLATEELLQALLAQNSVAPEDIISIVFTSTPDLTSEFPAVAARQLGLTEVPLLCAAEIGVPGALPRCIRVLLHLHTSRSQGELSHVYLRDASELRTDLLGP